MANETARDDLRRLAPSLVAALVMIALGALAVWFALQQSQLAQRDRSAAQSQRNASGQRLAQSRQEEQEIKQKIVRYNALAARGIIGEEHRLDWVEEIDAIKNARRLYDLQYEIAPQKTIDTAILPGASGNYGFYASTMQFTLQLLHEGDLLDFLADLRATARAYIRPRRCDVSRLPKTAAGADQRGPQPLLKAECTLDWITLREGSGS